MDNEMLLKIVEKIAVLETQVKQILEEVKDYNRPIFSTTDKVKWGAFITGTITLMSALAQLISKSVQ